MDGLVTHLREAIAVNRARKPYYARQTGGQSRALSNWLIAAETLLLPSAWIIDRWAARYHRQGAGIVRDDFVSMDAIPPKGRPPTYRGRASEAQQRDVQTVLRRLRRTVLVSGDRVSFSALCRHADAVLGTIDLWETTWGVHWAMTTHLVESLGYAALHGIDDARTTGGATRPLTRCLLAGHALLLPAAATLDVRAQAAHRRGAGILVNDVPPIPFRAAFRDRSL